MALGRGVNEDRKQRHYLLPAAPDSARHNGVVGRLPQRREETDHAGATTENVPGYRRKQTLGEVFGVVVRSRGLGGNIMAGLRSIVGGEIHEYTQLLEETRRQAVDRMVKNATVMGANAVVMMRFDSSEIGQTMSEIVAYGTAVILEPEG